MRCTALDHRLFFSLSSLLHALALVGLCLLPMQMRAGAGQPHPHALLHLMLDARDGSFDHHRAAAPSTPAAHGHATAADGTNHARPDLPTVGESIYAGVGLAVLLVLLTALLMSPTSDRIWATIAKWHGRLPVVIAPPPRLARV